MMAFVRHFVLFGLFLLDYFVFISGNAALIRPTARGMMWIKGTNSPTNYNYMGLNCGGLKKIRKHNGKCGLCGDPYDGPRDHELGGKYTTSAISKTYGRGQKVMEVKLLVNSFNKGHFEFRLCNAGPVGLTEQCFDQNKLKVKQGRKQGDENIFRLNRAGLITLQLEIPENLSCKRCVLQWKYITGNIWGRDESGKMCMGCGHQEMFINCADISIKGWTSDVVPAPTAVYGNDSSVTIFQSDTSSQDDSSSNFETQTAIPPPPPETINNTSNQEDYSPRIPRPPPVDYFLDAQEQDSPSAVTAPPQETHHNQTTLHHDVHPKKPEPPQINIQESLGIAHEYGHVTESPFFDGQLNNNASSSKTPQAEVVETSLISRDKQSVSARQLSVFPIGPKGHLHKIAANNEHHKLFQSPVDVLSESSKTKPARFSDVPITTANDKHKLATMMQHKYSELSPLEAEMTYQFPLQNNPRDVNRIDKQRLSNTKESSVLQVSNVKKLENPKRKHFPGRQKKDFTTTTVTPTVYQEMFTLRTSVYPKHTVEHKLHVDHDHSKLPLDHDHSKLPLVHDHRKPSPGRGLSPTESSFTDKGKPVTKNDNLPTLPYLSKTSKLSASDHAALFREMSFMKPSPFLYPPSKLEINKPSSSPSEISISEKIHNKPILETKIHQSKQNVLVLNKIRKHVNQKIPGSRISRQKENILQTKFKEKSNPSAQGEIDKHRPQVDALRSGKHNNKEFSKPAPKENGNIEAIVEKSQQNSDIVAPTYSMHQENMHASETNSDVSNSHTDLSKSQFEIRIYNQNNSVHDIPHNILSESKIMTSDNYQKIHEINSGWGTPLSTSDVLTKTGTISKLLKAQEMVNYAHDHIIPEHSDQTVMKSATINSDVNSLKTNRSEKPSSFETAGKILSVKNMGEAQKMVDYAHEHVHVPNLKMKDTIVRNSVPMATSNKFETSNKLASKTSNKVYKSKTSNAFLDETNGKLSSNSAKQENQISGGGLDNKLHPFNSALHSHGHIDQRTASIHHKQSVAQTHSTKDKSTLHSDTLRNNRAEIHDQLKVKTMNTHLENVESSAPEYAKAQDLDLSTLPKDNTGPVYKTLTKKNINQETKQSQAFQHVPTLKPSHNQPQADTAFRGHHQNHVSDVSGFGKTRLELSDKTKSSDIQPHKNVQQVKKHSHLVNGQQQEQNHHANNEHDAFVGHSHSAFSAKGHHHTTSDNMRFNNNFENVQFKGKGSKSAGKGHSELKHTHNLPRNNLNHHDNGDNGFSKDQSIQGNEFLGSLHDTHFNSNASRQNENIKSHKNVDHVALSMKPAILSDLAEMPKLKNLKGVQSLIEKTHMANLETHPKTSVSHKVIADKNAQPDLTSKTRDVTPGDLLMSSKHSQIDGRVNNEITLKHTQDNHRHLPAHEHHMPQQTASKLEAHAHSFKTENKLPQSSKLKLRANLAKDNFQTSVASASGGTDLTHKRLAIHKGSEQQHMSKGKHHPGLHTEHHSAGSKHTSHDSTLMQDKKHKHLPEIGLGKSSSTPNAHHHPHDLQDTQKLKGPESQRIPAEDLHMHDHVHGTHEVNRANTFDKHTKGKLLHAHKKNTAQSTSNVDSLSAESHSTEPHARKSAQATNIHDFSNQHTHMPHQHGHAESERQTHAHTHHPQSAIAKLRRVNNDNGNLNHHRDHTQQNVLAQIGHGDPGSGSTAGGTQLHTTHISPHDPSMFLNNGFNPTHASDVSHVAKVPESSHMLDHGPHEHKNTMPQINNVPSLLGTRNEQFKEASLIDSNNRHHLHDHAHTHPHTHGKQDWTASMKKTTIDDFVNRLTSHMESNINQTVSQGHDTHIKVLPLSKETIIQVLEAIAQGGRDASTVLSSHVTGSKADTISHSGAQDRTLAHDQPTETFNPNAEKVLFDHSNTPTSRPESVGSSTTSSSLHMNIDHNKRHKSNIKKDLPGIDLTSSELNSLNNDRSIDTNKIRNVISSDTAIAKNLKSEAVVETGMVTDVKKVSKLLDLTTVTARNRPDRQQILRSIDTSIGLDIPPALNTKSGSATSMDSASQPHLGSQQDTIKSSSISKLQASTDSQPSSHNKLKERIASLWRKPDTGTSSRQASRPLSRGQGKRKLSGSSSRFGGNVPFQRSEQKPVSSPKSSVPRLTHRPSTANRERSMPEYFPPSWRDHTAERQTHARPGSQANVRQRTFQDGRQRQSLGNNGIQWQNRPPLALRGFRGQPFSPRQAFMSSRLPTDEIRRIPRRQSRTRAKSNGRQKGRQLRTNPRLSETQINNRGLVHRSRSSQRQRTQSRLRPASSRPSRRFGSSRRAEGRASSRRRFSSSFLESNAPRSRGLDTIQRIRPNNNRRVMFVGSPEGAQRVISNTDLGRGKDALRKMRKLITQSEHRSAARGDPRRRIVVLPLNRKTVSRIFGEMGARRQR